MDKITRYIDTYNKEKIWIVKHTKCGHYYFNQEIKGELLNKGFKRTTKSHLLDTGILDMELETSKSIDNKNKLKKVITTLRCENIGVVNVDKVDDDFNVVRLNLGKNRKVKIILNTVINVNNTVKKLIQYLGEKYKDVALISRE